jgi:GNAT superfamily N-acetyltransferase
MGSASPSTVVRRVRPEDARVLRGVRLRALADSPEAFASTLADEEELDLGFWERRAARCSAGAEEATFLAFVDGGVAGMVGGYRPDDPPDTVRLVAMWVDPAWRRSGLGRRLVDHLLAWAGDHDAAAVTLWLTEGNEPARRLYSAAGFEPTEQTQPLPSHPHLTERMMRLDRPAAPQDSPSPGGAGA